MTLSTVTSAGAPAARVVLLKGFDESGFRFFTNYESDKGMDLAAHPAAALTFFWDKLQRQVRIVGGVSKVAREASAHYFHSRPRSSQLAAWISEQSRVISGREVLEGRMAEIDARFAGKEVDLPPFWGGYCVAPREVEFWQGRRSRLHDRLRYRRNGEGAWVMERLSP
jgi:pyridoxamine 5'-phosphate oxidase